VVWEKICLGLPIKLGYGIDINPLYIRIANRLKNLMSVII